MTEGLRLPTFTADANNDVVVSGGDTGLRLPTFTADENDNVVVVGDGTGFTIPTSGFSSDSGGFEIPQWIKDAGSATVNMFTSLANSAKSNPDAVNLLSTWLQTQGAKGNTQGSSALGQNTVQTGTNNTEGKSSGQTTQKGSTGAITKGETDTTGFTDTVTDAIVRSTTGGQTGQVGSTLKQEDVKTTKDIPDWLENALRGQVDASLQTPGYVSGMDVPGMTFANADIAGYMNPFLQAAWAPQARRMKEDQELALDELDAKSVSAGAFGGSRQELIKDLSNRRFNTRFDDAEAQMLNQGFQQATQLAGQDIGRGWDDWNKLYSSQFDQQKNALGTLGVAGQLVGGTTTTGGSVIDDIRNTDNLGWTTSDTLQQQGTNTGQKGYTYGTSDTSNFGVTDQVGYTSNAGKTGATTDINRTGTSTPGTPSTTTQVGAMLPEIINVAGSALGDKTTTQQPPK